MATTNPITGDKIQTKNVSDAYRDNYDLIFKKPTEEQETALDELAKLSEDLGLYEERNVT